MISLCCFLLLCSLKFLIETREIFVSSLKRNYCEQDKVVCDGSLENPFGSFYKSLKFVGGISNSESEPLIMTLLVEELSPKYILVDSEIEEPDSFSPFNGFQAPITIRGLNVNKPEGSSKAVISLRTEKLTLEVGSKLFLQNLELEGNNLPMARSSKACLITNEGCCVDPEEYFSVNQGCSLYKVKFQALNSNLEGVKYFSLIRSQNIRKDYYMEVELINVDLTYVNALTRWESFIYIDAERVAQAKITIKNTKIFRCDFPAGLLLYSGSPSPNVIARELNFEFDWLSVVDYKLYMIESIYKAYSSSLFNLEGSSEVQIMNSNMKSIFTDYSIFFLKGWDKVIFKSTYISEVWGRIIDSYAVANLVLENTLLTSTKNIPNENLINLISVTLSQSLEILNFKAFDNPVYFVFSNVSWLSLNDFVFENITLTLQSLFKVNEIKLFELNNLRVKNFSTNLGKLFNVIGNTEALIIKNSMFIQIAGSFDLFLTIFKKTRLGNFKMQSVYISDVSNKQNQLFYYPHYSNLTTEEEIAFENVTFERILSGQYLLRILNEEKISTKLHFRFINCSIKYSSLILMSTRDMNTFTTMLNCEFLKITDKRYIFLDLQFSSQTTLKNLSFTDCTSQEALVNSDEIAAPYYNFSCFDCKFIRLLNGKMDILHAAFDLRNCIFQNMESSQGKNILDVFWGVIVKYTNCTFRNINLYFYTSFLTDYLSEIHLINCVFDEIDIKMVGALFLISDLCTLYAKQTSFTNVKGSTPILFAVIKGRVYFENFYIRNFLSQKKGSIFMLFGNSFVSLLDSTFAEVTGAYNAPGFWMNDFGVIKAQNCIFKRFLGNKGGVFMLTKNNQVHINKSMFLNCSSTSDGGILIANGFKEINFYQTKFENSRTSSFGGVIYLNQYLSQSFSLINISACLFLNSMSANDGGVIFASNINKVLISDSVFKGSQGQNAGSLFAKSLQFLLISNCEFINSTALDNAGVFLLETVQTAIFNNSKFMGWKAISRASLGRLSNGEFLIEGCLISSSNIGDNTNMEVFNSVYTNLTLKSNIIKQITGQALLFYFYNHNLNYSTLTFTCDQTSFIQNTANSIFLSTTHLLISLIETNFINNNIKESLLYQVGGLLEAQTIFLSNNNYKKFLEVAWCQRLKADTLEIFDSEIGVSLINSENTTQVDVSKTKFKIPHSMSTTQPLTIFFLRNSNFTVFRFLNIENFDERVLSLKALDSDSSSLLFENSFFSNIRTDDGHFLKAIFLNRNLTFANVTFYNCDISSFDIQLYKKSFLAMKKFSIFADTTRECLNDFRINIGGDRKLSWIQINDSYFKGNRFLFYLDSVASVSIKNCSMKNIRSSSLAPFIFLSIPQIFIDEIDIDDINQAGCISFRFTVNSNSTLQISNSVIRKSENLAQGGAISILGSTTAILTNISFINCRSNSKGGALYLRSDLHEEATLKLKMLYFSENTAAWSGAAISAITQSEQVLQLMTDLLSKVDQIQTASFINNTAEVFKDQLQISSCSKNYKLQLSTELTQKELLELNGTFEEQMTGAPFNFSFYSGEKMNLVIKFYDDFMNPSIDFQDLTFTCVAEIAKDSLHQYLYKNNKRKVSGNQVNFTNMSFISLNFETQGKMTCYINNVRAGKYSTDHLFDQISISPVNFTQISCKIGQIIRENECKYCENSYSYAEKPKISDHCRPCPINSECVEGHLIIPYDGYWNWNSSSLKIFKCKPEAACKKSFNNSNRCAEGYHGNLCKECVPGYGKNFDDSCILCTEANSKSLIIREIAWYIWLISIIMCETLLLVPIGLKKFRKLLFGIRNLCLLIEVFSISFSVSKTVEPEIVNFFGLFSTLSFFRSQNFGYDCLISNIDDYSIKFASLLIWIFFHPFIFSFLISLILLFLKWNNHSYFLHRDYFFQNLRFLKVSLMISLYHFLPNFIFHCAKVVLCFEIFDGSSLFFVIPHPNLVCFDDNYYTFIFPFSLCLLIIYVFILLYLSCTFKTIDNRKQASLNYFGDGFYTLEKDSKRLLEPTINLTLLGLVFLIITQPNNKLSEIILRTLTMIPVFLIMLYGFTNRWSNFVFFYNFFAMSIANFLNLQYEFKERLLFIVLIIVLVSSAFLHSFSYVIAKFVELLKYNKEIKVKIMTQERKSVGLDRKSLFFDKK